MSNASVVAVMRDVVRTDPSPLNPKRWCLTLECRHEVWVTRQMRPTAKRVHCPACKAKFVLAEL